MFTKSFTNPRTLSLVFVMVAMLGIGMITPLQQVEAQTFTSEAEQRAALMEQVQQLMAILMQLLAQMEGQMPTIDATVPDIYSTEKTQDKKTSVINTDSNAPTGQCSISSNKQKVSLGETFKVSWSVDYENPTFVDEKKSEFSVKQNGSKEIKAMTLGENRYSLGSSKLGIVCSVNVEVINQLDEDKSQQLLEKSSRSDVCPFTWTRNLGFGTTGSDVKLLKKFLLTEDAVTTQFTDDDATMFGRPLMDALNEFQVAYRADILSAQGLVNPTGTFDSATRYKVNQICQ